MPANIIIKIDQLWPEGAGLYQFGNVMPEDVKIAGNRYRMAPHSSTGSSRDPISAISVTVLLVAGVAQTVGPN